MSGSYTSGFCGTDSLVNGQYGFAAGFASKITGNNSTAYGANSFAGGDNAVAIGARATAANASPYNGASNATALGAYSTAGVGGTATGMGSTANGMDAIAYGHSATADQSLAMAMGFAASARASNAIAIGANSSATASGSIALGSGSVASVANTVSVGTSGNERRIVNVAEGTVSSTSRDAVTGSQLSATNSLVATNTSALATLNSGLAATNANAVVAGTRIANALGGGSVMDGNNAPTAPNYTLFGSSYNNVGSALGAIETRTVTNATNITNLSSQVASGAIGLVQQASATSAIAVAATTGGDTVQFAGSAGTRRLTGLSNGTLSSTSTDAVTGAQLNATSNAVATNTATLTLTNQRLAGAFGGGSTIDANGVITAPSYTLFGTTHNNVGSAFGAIESRTNANTDAITNLSTQVASGAGGLVLQDQVTRTIKVASATDGAVLDVSGNAGLRRVTGLSAGALSGSSTDAVTGAQLNATNSGLASANQLIAQTVSNALTTNQRLASSFGGGSVVDPNGIVTAPSYTLFGTSYSNVGSALGAIESRTSSNTTQIASIWSQLGQTQASLLQQDATTNDLSVANQTGGTIVNFAGRAGSRLLTGLSGGAIVSGSTDAVTGAQLNDTNTLLTSVSSNLTTLTSNMNAGQQRIAAAFGGGSALDSNGLATAPNYAILGSAYSNVGGALAALNSRVQSNSSDISNLMAGAGSGAGGPGLVTQNTTSRNIQVASATDGAVLDASGISGARTLTGVAPGQLTATSRDVVNGAQLNSTNMIVASLSATTDTAIANAATGLSRDISAAAARSNNTAVTIANAIGGGAVADGNGNISVPQFRVQNAIYSSVGGAFGALDQATVNNANAVQTMAVSVNNLLEKNRFISVTGRGADAAATGTQSIALGSQAMSSGAEAVAIGADSVASAIGAIAVGNLSAATGRNAIAIGVNALATGSVALGVNARASNGGAALGDDSVATGADSAALGPKATATAANSVAIGSGSVASTPNVVSVGASGNERRVTNVASGIERTDAVNVGQLQDYQSTVAGQLTEFSQRISQVTGGVAMAMAMSGGALPENKSAGLAVNVGAFGGQTALGISNYLRLHPNIVLSSAVGFQQRQIGGRAGLLVAW